MTRTAVNTGLQFDALPYEEARRWELQRYLQNGTQEVWQVYPKSRSVVVHRGAASQIFSSGQQLTTPLLPAFTLDLQALDAVFAK